MAASLATLVFLSITLGAILAWSIVDFLPWWTRYGFWLVGGAVILLPLGIGYFVSFVTMFDSEESEAESETGTDDASRWSGRTLGAVGVVSLAILVGGWGWFVLRPTVLGSSSPLPGLGRSPLAYLALMAVFGLLQVAIGYLTILTGEKTYTASKESYPDLDASVTRLAQAADIGKPRIAVVESPAPNSMAMRLGTRSTIVVSTGLLDTLSDDELDAVLAHELAHLKNRDATVMTLAQSVSAFARRLVTAGANFHRSSTGQSTESKSPRRDSHHSDSDWGPDEDVNHGTHALFVSFYLRVVTVLLAWPFWVVGLFTYATLSRYRELAADRGAVAITGKPDALASALRTLDGDGPPGMDLRLTEESAKPACIVPHGFSESARGSESIAFRTHPTLERRLSNLERLSAELESR